MPITVYIALGANLGDRQEYLQRSLLAMPPKVQPLSFSPVYETPPWGYIAQPSFLNQVVQAETELSPVDLLAYLKDLETALGRQETFPYGPRQIDLDILFYDDLVMQTPLLEIPHPRLHERAFVLVPLNDLAPDLRHPVLHLTVREMLQQVDITGVKPYLGRTADGAVN